jgi:DNA-binding NtrC family response regulator
VDGRAAIVGAFLGDSHPIRVLRERTAALAQAQVPVLFWGEPGTGKRLLAALLHRAGRPQRPLVQVPCGDLRNGGLSEFFRAAGDGTLLLERVEAAPEATQLLLTEVLRDRVAGSTPLVARVIATCRGDPVALCERGRLEVGLYEVLAGAVLEVPPLRARPGDARILAEHFLRLHRDLGYGDVRWGAEALEVVSGLDLPGNAAELECLTQRAAVLRRRGEISAGDLAAAMRLGGELDLRRARAEALRAFSQSYVDALLSRPPVRPARELPPALRQFVRLWRDGLRSLDEKHP